MKRAETTDSASAAASRECVDRLHRHRYHHRENCGLRETTSAHISTSQRTSSREDGATRCTAFAPNVGRKILSTLLGPISSYRSLEYLEIGVHPCRIPSPAPQPPHPVTPRAITPRPTAIKKSTPEQTTPKGTTRKTFSSLSTDVKSTSPMGPPPWHHPIPSLKSVSSSPAPTGANKNRGGSLLDQFMRTNVWIRHRQPKARRRTPGTT